MDDEIIQNLNDTVEAYDTLYFLGDFCFGPAQKIRDYRARINCKNIIFIKGNHDKQLPDKTFAFVKDMLEVKFSDHSITLCHYAMRKWNKSHHGAWHLYGHSHNTLDEHGLSFDCGVDGHSFRPWSFDEVVQKMEAKLAAFAVL
jgi:calcineurin-like phosphoesterase family protein